MRLRAAKSEFRRELAKEVVDHNGIDPTVVARWIDEGGTPAVAPHPTIPPAELGPLAHRIAVTARAASISTSRRAPW